MKKIVTCAVSMLMLASTSVYANYDLLVEAATANKKNAGTDDKIYVTVHGSLGSSVETRLDRGDVNDFERGKSHTYRIRGPQQSNNIGDILGVTVRLGGKAKDGWGIDYIKVTEKTNKNNTATFFKGGDEWIDDKAEHKGMVLSLTRMMDNPMPINWHSCSENGDYGSTVGYFEYKPMQEYAKDSFSWYESTIKRDVWKVGSVKMNNIDTKRSYAVSTEVSGYYDGITPTSKYGGKVKMSGEMLNQISNKSSNTQTSNYTSDVTTSKGAEYSIEKTGLYHHVRSFGMRNGIMQIGVTTPIFVPINNYTDAVESVMDHNSFLVLEKQKCSFVVRPDKS
jgi:hypothetical protein